MALTPKQGRKRSGSISPTPPNNPKSKNPKPSCTEAAKSPEEERPSGNADGNRQIVKKEKAKENAQKQEPREVTFAKRRFRTQRIEPTEIDNLAEQEAKLSLALSKTLRECGCKKPMNLQVRINQANGMVTFVAPPGNEAKDYVPYFEKITKAMNSTIDKDKETFTLTRAAPVVTSVVVHGVLFQHLPDNEEEMKNEVKESIPSSYGITVLGVRFLEKQVARIEKKGISIIITIPAEEAE